MLGFGCYFRRFAFLFVVLLACHTQAASTLVELTTEEGEWLAQNQRVRVGGEMDPRKK